MNLNNNNEFDQGNQVQFLSGNPRNMDENTFHESPEEDEDATSYGTDRNRNYGHSGKETSHDRNRDREEDSNQYDEDLNEMDQEDLNDDFNSNSFDREDFDTE